MTDSIDTSEREAEEPRAGRSNARPSNRDAFLPVVVEDLTGVSEEGRQIIYALERARDENHAHAMRLLGAKDYGAELPGADAECIDKAIRLIVGYSRLERVNAELVEALNACLEKGARWHPCDPVVIAARAALTSATKETKE